MLPNQINPDEYWSIHVQSGVAWHYVMSKLCAPLAKINPTVMAVVFGDGANGTRTYMLKKEFLPVAALAYAVGMDVPTLKKLKHISLNEKHPEGLPHPTVNYWGEA